MWFMKMKNSEKMDPNINFAVICNKQHLFVVIPIYNIAADMTYQLCYEK